METIGVDLGNCNIKTSKGIIVPSLITKGENYLISTGYQITFNNEVFIIGEGDYDTNLDKIEKENLLPMLTLALGLSTKEQVIRIVLGLPINQYRSKKDKMLEVIEDNKILNFILNGEERTIYIEDAAIFPEGVATYYSLDIEKRKALVDKDLIVLDIGGRTTDIALLKAGKKRSVAKSISLDVGMINIYNDLINEINSQYTLALNIEDAENIIKNGLEVDGERKDTGFIKNIIRNNIERVFKELNISYPVRTSPILVTGGGGRSFFKSIKKRYPSAVLVEDNLFSNAIGYKKVGEKLWRD
ncbi:ParM/StbA family protein [Clostridium celatum]|uniref:ParM/StbA family protein n=1 Tax=Clostridium celatum TaxID=36834 RepID=UPI00290CCA5A|nr:ParM/StbA family protein [Clostridium celatum]MDU6295294.1 ParM/StbA family protein [Clostridium celatum]